MAGIEPAVWVGIALAAMFVARPIAILITDDFVLRGRIDIRDSLRQALLIALIGVTAFVIGYCVALGRELAERTPPLPELPQPAVIARYATVLLGAAVIAQGFASVVSGTSLTSIASATSGSGSSVAYFYLAPFLAIPAAMLYMAAGFRAAERRFVALAIAICLLLVVVLAPAGQRLWVLLSVTSVALYPYLRGSWRPSRTVVLVTVAVAFLALTVLRDLRPGDGVAALGSTMVSNLADPTGALKTVFTGGDAEMVDGFAAATTIVPDVYPFKPGQSITTLLAQPIPRALWQDKPRPLDDALNDQLFRNSLRGGAGNAQVATSIMANFYLDSGIIGVIIGMFAVGVIGRMLWEYCQCNRQNDGVLLVYAVCLPLLVIAMRGSLPITLGRALFVLGPLLVATIVLGERGRHQIGRGGTKR